MTTTDSSIKHSCRTALCDCHLGDSQVYAANIEVVNLGYARLDRPIVEHIADAKIAVKKIDAIIKEWRTPDGMES